MAKNNTLNNDISTCAGLPPAGISIGANSAMIVSNSSGAAEATGTMTDGQVIIGSTGATPTATTLTAGTGITVTNGAGIITIAASGGAAANGLLNVQYLTTTGTYTATAGTVSCQVIVVAGGGGGGGAFAAASTPNTRYQSMYGGWGSGYGMKYYAVAPTGTAYVIGAGGAGGVAVASSVTGDAGADSTFNDGDMVIAGGNGGGSAKSYVSNQLSYSQPPVMTISQISAAGAGDSSDLVSSKVIPGFVRSGAGNGGSGGSSIFGSGGTSAYSSSTSNGNDATGYGSGGGGSQGSGYSSNGVATGGDGSAGIIVVYEYGA